MLLPLAHLAVTCFLTGLIWTVQLVQYPLFARVGADAWNEYHAGHTALITLVVGPMMLLELVLAGLLLLERPSVLTWTGAALVAVVWLSTAFVQVPLHGRLSSTFERADIRRLVLSNWLRTVAWTLRVGLALALVLERAPEYLPVER